MLRHRSLRNGQLMIVLVGGLGSASTLRGQTATFRGLSDLPGGHTGSFATGVSADGSVVVGVANFVVSSSMDSGEAFRWTPDQGMIGLSEPARGFLLRRASAVSADGAIVAVRGAADRSDRALVWSQIGGVMTLGQPSTPDSISQTTSASADGSVIVGRLETSDRSEAFRWTAASGIAGLGHLVSNGRFSTALDVSADGRAVVGQSTSGRRRDRFEAFLWTANDGMLALDDLSGGAFESVANAISGDGSTVVGRGTSGLGSEAFLWTRAGGLRGLGDLPGGVFFSSANDVSADGSVVVGSSKAARFQDVLTEAFLWDVENGMRNLSEVLAREPDVDLTGWILLDAIGVSADGCTIVGWGLNPAGDSEAWLATLPARGFEPETTEQASRTEPSSQATTSEAAPLPCAAPVLMLLTLLGLGIVRRQTRNNHPSV